MAQNTLNLSKFIGRSLEGLPLEYRWKLSGFWVASELYSPQRLPLRIIEAIGANAHDCIDQLRTRGLDPTRFEYAPVPQPYAP